MLTLASEEKSVFGRSSHSAFFQQEHLLELFFAMFYASVNVIYNSLNDHNETLIFTD